MENLYDDEEMPLRLNRNKTRSNEIMAKPVSSNEVNVFMSNLVKSGMNLNIAVPRTGEIIKISDRLEGLIREQQIMLTKTVASELDIPNRENMEVINSRSGIFTLGGHPYIHLDITFETRSNTRVTNKNAAYGGEFTFGAKLTIEKKAEDLAKDLSKASNQFKKLVKLVVSTQRKWTPSDAMMIFCGLADQLHRDRTTSRGTKKKMSDIVKHMLLNIYGIKPEDFNSWTDKELNAWLDQHTQDLIIDRLALNEGLIRNLVDDGLSQQEAEQVINSSNINNTLDYFENVGKYNDALRNIKSEAETLELDHGTTFETTNLIDFNDISPTKSSPQPNNSKPTGEQNNPFTSGNPFCSYTLSNSSKPTGNQSLVHYNPFK